MAQDIDITGTLTQGINVAGATHTIVTILYVVIIAACIGVIGWFIWRTIQYKVRYKIRKITGDRTLLFEDRARIIKKKGQPTRWKLKKLKEYVPVPPKDAIEITTKGKQYVEAYYTEDGEIVYIIDRIHSQSKIGNLYPVKTSDKEFYVQQLAEADKYKVKNWKDVLITLAPIMAIVLILVIFMVFFDKAIAPATALGDQLIKASDTLIKAMETLNTCAQNVPIAPV